ncbi:MAG: hypothetical protein IK012_03435 [Fibrobacter sp.]|uniref:hypothetical protein n=1 Tax=Fibrobacter sp. TaxID=35828 RepID=UPI0025C587FC|nr:hypothetical protein [Fibrobacter sp.]MBR4784290.1 hypothetical protein [Fibrobacter sp.]
MLKKFASVSGAFLLVFLFACSGEKLAGGTIDPNSNPIANNSSSSVANVDVTPCSSEMTNDFEWSSSERLAGEVSSSSYEELDLSSSSQKGSSHYIQPDPESSSSERDRSDVSVIPRNVSFEYLMDVAVEAGDSDFVDTPDTPKDVQVPYASKSVTADSVNILVNDYFRIPCDEDEAVAFMDQLKSPRMVSVDLAGDTIHIEVARNNSVTYDCMCVATVKFTLNARYSSLNYVVLEQSEAIPLKEPE